jgi:hypothetical protein
MFMTMVATWKVQEDDARKEKECEVSVVSMD